ncbi:sulfotransferase family protein [Flavobacterium branchiicola]|uniref:Sulfotransferase family protein n=1 Tax=Flavobacterium branchiicola TaxID=1114875 RepID=A0ABV9PGZ1_9FLAO|nr:sulfotransferase family protein [Flavobacterium branchiicola]MBS7254371.1 sulfotransferase family protein [Flavobacterium branchiicola]
MENITHSLLNWIPIKLIEKDNEIYFEWIYLGDFNYEEPFFDETIARSRQHPYNSSWFKTVSTLDNLIDWSKELVSVELKSLVFHVSRCGSTMLSQCLATSAENIMISEAPIIDQILRSESFDLEKKTVLLKSVIALLGQKRFPEQKNLIIKLDAWHIFNAPYLRSVFPEIPFALLYRNPAEVLRSHQKMTGMHMVPNLLSPDIFGITSKEIEERSFRQYGALVLEKYYQGFLDFNAADKNVIMLNYNEGMRNVMERFISFIAVQYSNNELDQIYDRLKKHSKNGTNVFTGDSYKDDVLAVDLEKVIELHEKLNACFTEDLVG